MKKPLPEPAPLDVGMILDDRVVGPFDKPPPTPEEARRAEARLKSFGKYCDERRSPDIKDEVACDAI
jgi:hypothetical protein